MHIGTLTQPLPDPSLPPLRLLFVRETSSFPPSMLSLDKMESVQLSSLNSINISYFWTRHVLYHSLVFSPVCSVPHSSATAQLRFAESFLVVLHMMPQTIFCILKTTQLQSLLYQQDQTQIIPCSWILLDKWLAAAGLCFLSAFSSTLHLIVQKHLCSDGGLCLAHAASLMGN